MKAIFRLDTESLKHLYVTATITMTCQEWAELYDELTKNVPIGYRASQLRSLILGVLQKSKDSFYEETKQ